MAGTLPTGDGDEEPAPRQLGEGGRYRLLRSLGRGAFGSVFHAVDSKYDGAVAIKLLHRRNADALYRFKREFRDLVDLIHPNLVRLYELSNDGERWFVVMELVDGVDLRSFLRGVGVGAARAATVTARSNAGAATALASAPQWVEIDLPRLRATFAQFVRGIQALHAAHKLHRDLKPSNVLVAPDGRVVILDFGLMVELDRALGALSGPGIGTPGYMAPEQARDAPLSPAADWYAVGAMLYEVLTGATPVHGATAFDDSRVPRGLRDLVDRLLAGDPRRRPDGDEILSVLEAVPSSAGSTAAFTSTGIVGRDAELRLLDRARAEARVTPVLVRIRGVSGVGKTTLLSTWADRVEAAGDGEWVLRGRCFEHEDVPFKAIDGVVDALAERLMAEPELVRPTLSLESLRAAARMFPVLGGLLGAAPPSSDVQPRAQRDRAMAGMRELFASVAAIHPLVMCIDDAHWGDADSARVVAELLQLSAAKLLIVTSERPSAALDAFPAALSDWLGDRARAPARDVELRELGADDARALAAVCGSAPDDAPRIALESGGNPFFIRELAEHHADDGQGAPVGLGELMARKLERLPAAGRQVVELLSLAARPLAEEVVARAADVERSSVRAAIAAAVRERWIAGRRVAGSTLLEPIHDRVREEVVRRIAPSAARGHHRRIADALLAAGEPEPESLLPHFLGAEDHERAADFAVRAAGRAEAVLAFERAAEHYALALKLEHGEATRASLFERRATALANAGRSAGAAESFDAAVAIRAREPYAAEHRIALRDLKRRSAENWLRSGYVAEGLARLDEVLRELRIALPASTSAALRATIWRRLRLLARGLDFRARPPEQIPADVHERLDALWAATTSLAMLKLFTADALGLQHLLEALDAGDAARITRSLVWEAGWETIIGGGFFDRRCQRMLAQIDGLVSSDPSPSMRAWNTMVRGVIAWYHGDWLAAWTGCHEAATLYARECHGVSWELAVCDVYRLSALTYLGRFADLAAIVPAAHLAARERGDLYVTNNLAFFENYVLIALDRPEEAIALAERAVTPFSRAEFLSIHYGIAYAIAQGELYRGRPAAAWDIVERDWPAWRSSGMARAQCVRVEIRYLRGRAALAFLQSGASGAAAKRARRALAEDITRLERDRVPPAQPMAQALAAGRLRLDGKSAEVAALLRLAAEGFEHHAMALHAGAARHHLARITQDERDRERARLDAERMAAEGVVRPTRMFDLAITGFEV